MAIIIYKIWNTCTGKWLIGVTRKDTESALDSWMKNCGRSRYDGYLIKEDYKKYGKKTFQIEKITTCGEKYGDALEVADSYIEQFNTLEPYGYNSNFLGLRKIQPDFYKEQEEKELVPIKKEKVEKDKMTEEAKTIAKTDFRKKSELLNRYGITGLDKNNVPQIFAEKETINSLRALADKLERYGSNQIYEYVPAELNIETNTMRDELLSLLKEDAKISKTTYVAVPKGQIQCQKCGTFRDPNASMFYKHPDISASKDGYIHLCRACIEKVCKETFSYSSNIQYTILIACQLANVIFVQQAAEMAEKSWNDRNGKIEEVFKYYMSELNYVWLNQEGAPTTMLEFRHSNFEGDIFGFVQHHPATPKVFFKELNKGIVKKIEKTEEKQQDELESKWGRGFELQEYKELEQEYEKLEKFLPKKTDLHIEALKKYIIYSLKEKVALAKGDLKDVKEWNGLADKAADNAQLKIKQLSDSFGAEVDGFAKLVETVEEYNSVIPILPKVRKMPYDDIDFIIWETVNYIRRLEGKPETTYEEVYQFIDTELTRKMVDAGMTKKQIEKAKEQRNAVFNDLSDNYIEPLWIYPDEDEDENEENVAEEGDT